MKIYKIRNKTTGLYATAKKHGYMDWNKTGKVWNHIGHIKNHLHQINLKKENPYENAEIVEFEISTAECGSRSVNSLIDEMGIDRCKDGKGGFEQMTLEFYVGKVGDI